jgi:hypothetical protein
MVAKLHFNGSVPHHMASMCLTMIFANFSLSDQSECWHQCDVPDFLRDAKMIKIFSD